MRVSFKMKYINNWTDELGRKRYRFRRKGFPGVELPVNSDPASPEFQAAYHAAMRGERQEHALAMVAARGGSGTVGDAVQGYLASTLTLMFLVGSVSIRCIGSTAHCKNGLSASSRVRLAPMVDAVSSQRSM